MKIATAERVIYARNPLAEVVCQIRFERIGELIDNPPAGEFGRYLRERYSEESVEQVFDYAIRIPVNPSASPSSEQIPSLKIFHFASGDASWKLSICADFIAITCGRYRSWDDFLPRMLELAAMFSRYFPHAVIGRIGLRYKDLIEREALGLKGVPWHELIQPFLLGPLGLNALSDDIPDESDVESLLTQSAIRLETCKMLLQSSLLRSEDRDQRAFLIDADFFNEEARLASLGDVETLRILLDTLHSNAGALFARGITARLRHALGAE